MADMAKWQVKTWGAMSGAEYVYVVDGPADATPAEITNHVRGLHGRYFRDGVVPEPIGLGAFVTPIG